MNDPVITYVTTRQRTRYGQFATIYLGVRHIASLYGPALGDPRYTDLAFRVQNTDYCSLSVLSSRLDETIRKMATLHQGLESEY